MGADKIGICNQSLAEIPADAISSFDERAVAAQWCARLYAPTLRYMLDMHDWKFSTARVVLAQVENPRPGEWSFAYAIPNDCITELRVMPTFDATTDSVPIFAGLALSPWMVGGLAVPPIWRFLISAGLIFSNIEDATLEYIQGTPNESVFKPLFERAFVLELASRLVMPITNVRGRQGELIKMAEAARGRAFTDELNRDDSEGTYGEVYMNETEIARAGGSRMGAFPFSPFGPWN